MGAAGRIEKPQEMVGKARTRRERGRAGRPGETNPGLDLDHPSSACIIFGHHRRNLHPGRRLVAPGAMHPPLSLSSPGRPGLSRSRSSAESVCSPVSSRLFPPSLPNCLRRCAHPAPAALAGRLAFPDTEAKSGMGRCCRRHRSRQVCARRSRDAGSLCLPFARC